MIETSISFGRKPQPPIAGSRRIEVFDPAMCCSSGVCGPEVDPKLVQFAADLAWLKSEGVAVQRHNLSQDPASFVGHALVQTALTESGEAALPLLVCSGSVVSQGRYPARSELATWFGLTVPQATVGTESCCSGGGGC